MKTLTKNHGQENIRVAKLFYEAAGRGDMSHAREALDPNVEWIEPNIAGLWFSGTHRGADAVWKEVFAPTPEKIEKFRVKMRKFYAVGDHVIVIGHIHGKGKATGKELDAATAHVWTFRNGKAVRFEAFHDTESWLEALGLAHPEPQRMAA
jgi:ketosteroid isomerase-like protein